MFNFFFLAAPRYSHCNACNYVYYKYTRICHKSILYSLYVRRSQFLKHVRGHLVFGTYVLSYWHVTPGMRSCHSKFTKWMPQCAGKKKNIHDVLIGYSYMYVSFFLLIQAHHAYTYSCRYILCSVGVYLPVRHVYMCIYLPCSLQYSKYNCLLHEILTLTILFLRQHRSHWSHLYIERGASLQTDVLKTN